MAYRLLSLGDDPRFIGLIRSCAGAAGYQLETLNLGTLGMKAVRELRPDLVFLDVRIADMEGLTWLKMLRQTDEGKDLPVVVAGDRKTDAEVAEAFEWGADDFVLKECDPAELSARIRAVLRRRFERQEVLGQAMSLGPVLLDPSRHECRVRGKRVDLNPREFELLEILMRKAGRVLSRVYLLETIWGMSRYANTRAVDVGISRLRRSLGKRAGRLIKTEERFGYVFRLPEPA